MLESKLQKKHLKYMCNYGDLVNGWMSLGLSLRGGVQPPERGEAASAFTEGTRHGLAPPPDAALCASRHL